MPHDKGMTENPIVLVTGGNRGIGLEIAAQMAQRGWRVLLGSRQAEAGRQATASLKERLRDALAEPLLIDIDDEDSVQKAFQRVSADPGAVDVLINNAGILLDEDATILTVSDELLEHSFRVNTVGPLRVSRVFLPLLRKSSRGARIINLSSGAGALSDMETFKPAYSISKTALNAVTRQMAANLRVDGIPVNSMCPGWVRTDMGGPNATRSVEEGADTAVWLATEAPPEWTGGFYRDRREIAW